MTKQGEDNSKWNWEEGGKEEGIVRKGGRECDWRTVCIRGTAGTSRTLLPIPAGSEEVSCPLWGPNWPENAVEFM